MAGTWVAQNKVRPGAYINFKAATKTNLQPGERGVAALPMRLSWGPVGETIHITADEVVRGKSLEYLGLKTTDDGIVPLVCALENAPEALVYRMGTGGRKAYGSINNAVGVSAMYPGALGNDIVITVLQRSTSKYDIITSVRGTEVDRQTVTSVAEFVPNNWVEFSRASSAYQFTPVSPMPSGISNVNVAGLDEVGDVIVRCMPLNDTDYQLVLDCNTIEYTQNYRGAAWAGIVSFSQGDVLFRFATDSMYGVFTPYTLPVGISNLLVSKATTGGTLSTQITGNATSGFTITCNIDSEEYSTLYPASAWTGTVNFNKGPISFDFNTRYWMPYFVPVSTLPGGVSNLSVDGMYNESDVTLTIVNAGGTHTMTVTDGVTINTQTFAAEDWTGTVNFNQLESQFDFDTSALDSTFAPITNVTGFSDVTCVTSGMESAGSVTYQVIPQFDAGYETSATAYASSYVIRAAYNGATYDQTYTGDAWSAASIVDFSAGPFAGKFVKSVRNITTTEPASLPTGVSSLVIPDALEGDRLVSGPLYLSGTVDATTSARTLKVSTDIAAANVIASQTFASADWTGSVSFSARHMVFLFDTTQWNTTDAYTYAELCTVDIKDRATTDAAQTVGTVAQNTNVLAYQTGAKIGTIDASTARDYAAGVRLGAVDVTTRQAWINGQTIGSNATVGDLTPVAGVVLTGGVDPVYSETTDYGNFMTALRDKSWNCVAIPTTSGDIPPLVLTYIKGLRENDGKKVQAVVYDYPSADYEGIISMTQGYKIGDEVYDVTDAICWFAGATAAAQLNESNTYKVVTGATSIIGVLEPEAIEDALNGGQLVLSTRQDGTVIVEKDINTLHSFSEDKTYSFSKNRVVRTLDDIATQITIMFENSYIGKVNNNEDGRTLFKGDIIGYINELVDMDAVQNFDSANDIEVLEGADIDSIVCNLWLQPVDSMEKLYMTVTVS